MSMLRGILPRRSPDKFGSGHFGAPRGERKHNGVDLACYPGTGILAYNPGTITKFGYPYGDDLQYRYIEVTNPRGYKERYFYVLPNKNLLLGDEVARNDYLGLSQALGPRYEGITEHIHFEVKDPDGRFLDPNTYIITGA